MESDAFVVGGAGRSVGPPAHYYSFSLVAFIHSFVRHGSLLLSFRLYGCLESMNAIAARVLFVLILAAASKVRGCMHNVEFSETTYTLLKTVRWGLWNLSWSCSSSARRPNETRSVRRSIMIYWKTTTETCCQERIESCAAPEAADNDTL